MNNPIEQAHDAIRQFLDKAKEPAIVQPGDEPIPLVAGSYNIELAAGRLFVEAWTRDRTLSRRITGVIDGNRGAVQLSIERFGKREGTVNLIDLAGPRSSSVTRKAARQTYREQFRRSLLRQFPGWRVAELSTDPDLEHSLSPAYPRALLRKGAAGYAAIGCPPDSQDVEAVLTFGLIWLDYLRKRAKATRVTGLAVFVPEGKQRFTCLRLLHLDPRRAEWSAFVYTERLEDRVDLRDYGNIDTVLPVRAAAADAKCAWWAQKLSALPQVTMREEQGSRLCWTVRGLAFARWEPGAGLTFGIETKHSASESNLSEIEGLAQELARFRSPDAADRYNPLYLTKPELWLESQACSALREIDASLESGPVYRQAPAFAGGERSVLDLLAVNHEGRLVVVEVKASEDLHLPLQALDYWIRVRWHAARDDFRHSGYFLGKSLLTLPPKLILVAPALYFHPTTDTLVRYFSPDVDVLIAGLAMDWRTRVRVMFRRERELRP